MTKQGAVEVAMTFKKETVGTYVFEAGDDKAITQLYIRKAALDGTKVTHDTTITVNVNFAN